MMEAADHLAYPAVYVRFDTIEDSVDVAGNIREFAAGREWDLVCVEDYTREKRCLSVRSGIRYWAK